jgi:hypothetical protein
VLSGFPTPQCVRIDTHSLSHSPLREAKHLAPSGNALSEGASGGQRIIAQELDNGRDEVDFRRGFIAFPVGNCERMNPDLVRDLPLEEFEV